MAVTPHLRDPYRPPESEHTAHVDALWSLALHAVVIAAAYYILSHHPMTMEAQRRVTATNSAAISAAATQRLNDLSRIEQALANSMGDPPPSPPAPAATPKEALRQARERYEAIREMQRRARVKDLAALLDIPLDEATQRAGADMPPLPPAARTEEEAAAQLAQLQTQARNALARYRDNLRRRDAQRTGLAGADARGRGGADDASSRALAPLEAALDQFDVLLEPPRRAPVLASGRPAPVPSVDPGPMRVGAGRRIGPGGVHANRIYVDTWYVLGPFEAQGTRPLDFPYPPESAVDLDGTYAGKRGRILAWAYLQAGEYPTYLPDPAENAIYYGYTELMLDRDRQVWAWIGADDDSKVWVDDQLVWTGGAPMKPWFLVDARSMTREIAEHNLTEGKVRLRLRRGRNRILFKLHNGVEVMFFSLVLTDAQASNVQATEPKVGPLQVSGAPQLTH